MNVSIDLAGQPPPPSYVSPQMQTWDEDWLFQRSVRPGGDPMIRPPACPSCGAPTRVDETGLCTHCRAEVPFLTTGWLASGIVSRNPFYALMREKMAEQLRAEAESAGPMSPEMMRLLPRGVTPDGSIEDTPPGWTR